MRLTVVKTLTTDQSGAPLTNEGSNGGSANESRTWNDAVYLQVLCPASDGGPAALSVLPVLTSSAGRSELSRSDTGLEHP